ncbi:MAG: hypothetical protein N2572_08190 [Syntrophales bacterium]|nr:hypothetical protein [Syntrophales bacterium]
MVEEKVSVGLVAAAQACISRGEWEKALELAQKRLSQNPKDIEASYIFIRASIKKGDDEKAISALREITSVDEHGMELYRELGDMLCERAEWEKAYYYYMKYIDFFPAPQVVRALKKVVAEFAIEEDRPPAVDKEVPPDFQTLTLVDLYVKQGHLKEALEVLESMKRRDPANEKIIERIKGVQALMGEETESQERRKKVLAELDRWLQNIYRSGLNSG